MILQSARIYRFCHHQLRLVVDYTPMHHLMIMATLAEMSLSWITAPENASGRCEMT